LTAKRGASGGNSEDNLEAKGYYIATTVTEDDGVEYNYWYNPTEKDTSISWLKRKVSN